MKIMISQPMKGLTKEQIEKNREDIVNLLTREGHEVIDTILTDTPPEGDNTSLWYLSKSLELMSKCDCVYFMEGFEKARGCVIEHTAALNYGLKIRYYYQDEVKHRLELGEPVFDICKRFSDCRVCSGIVSEIQNQFYALRDFINKLAIKHVESLDTNLELTETEIQERKDQFINEVIRSED